MSEEFVGSSRIYVAGLPPYLDDKRFRDAFSERGEITDAKIQKTRDGRSRQFGFIGFQSVDQAKDAIHYFNNSYIDTHRIQVKFAEKAQSSNLERPWSVHSAGSSKFSKRTKAQEGKPELTDRRDKKRQKKRLNDADPEDPELEEFLRVMQPRSKAATWANDDAVPEASKSKAVIGKPVRAKNEKSKADTDDEDEADFQDLSDSKHLKDDDGSLMAQAPDKTETRRIDAVVADAGVSDLEYLKARMKTGSMDNDIDAKEEDSGSEDIREEDSGDEGQTSRGSAETEVQADAEGSGSDSQGDITLQQRQASHLQASTSGAEDDEADTDLIAKTGRLFLRNLPYQATESDLAALFEGYGELSEVHLVKDRLTHKSKGIALVQFMEADDAAAAHSALDGTIFQGRLIHILPAKPLPKSQHTVAEEETAEGPKPSNFKAKKEAAQKSDAGNRAAWNSLFMRPDTVAEAVAAHYGISKSQLLDREAADLPVRMALGEAHVIALTKSGLAEAGVNVEALERSAAGSGSAATAQPGVERSSTVLLVKNLPYTATEADLLETFGKAGLVSKLVMPKTKTLALIQYQKPGEARQAFKTLAFKRFQAAPLFLEWAPKDIFKSAAPTAGPAAKHLDKTQPAQEEVPVDVSLLKAEEDEVESRSIFIKNLSWSTKDAGLMRHFDATVSAAGGSIRSAKVAQRKGPDGKPLSAGFGFLECSSEAVAKATIKKLQGSMIDGHKLVLLLSMKKSGNSSSVPAKGAKDPNSRSTKIVVRNVAFEATSKEIRALFQPFGQIKSVRLPKKFNNSHRGFAFVDFLSHQEAVNAMNSVAGTHLYGRRLVTEWAAQDEGLDELRMKTAAKYSDATETQI